MKQAIKFRHSLLFGAVWLSQSSHVGAQPACFSSIGAAVRGTGAEDQKGFRVEAVTRNQMDGLGWARVRSCSHPEWPPHLVPAAAGTSSLQHSTPIPSVRPSLVIHAGTPVTVLSTGESVRLQVAGTAIEGGALGQRVRVRIACEGEERFIAGLVLSADTLEMVR